MKTEFKWDKPLLKIASDVFGGSEGLLCLADSAARLMDDYVPADNLVLAQNIDVYVEGDRGIIHYLSPYAHYQWEGILYVDKKTGKGCFTDGEGRFWSRPGVSKVPTEKKLKYSDFRHPLATSHWDEAMMRARRGDLVKSLENLGNCETQS